KARTLPQRSRTGKTSVSSVMPLVPESEMVASDQAIAPTPSAAERHAQPPGPPNPSTAGDLLFPGCARKASRPWGVTDGGHRRTSRGKGGCGPTSLTCLTPPGADVQRRTIPVPEESAERQAHLAATRERQKSRQRGRNVP